jgi:hypothetical protein
MEFDSHEAAWSEMSRICADLPGSVARNLMQNGESRMELLDDVARKPVFGVRRSPNRSVRPRLEMRAYVGECRVRGCAQIHRQPLRFSSP